MSIKLNEINGEASEFAFGFKATSRSLKPVHLAQVLFSYSLEYVHSPSLLFEFAEKPNKKPSEELDDEILKRIEFTHQVENKYEELDTIRRTVRKVLANDNALYASQQGSAPTSSSDWFVTSPMAGVTVGQFLNELIEQSDGDLKVRLVDQLQDHQDSISVLFRPLSYDAEKSSKPAKPWTEPTLGDSFGDGKIADNLSDGYSTLAQHLKVTNGGGINYPRDLRRVVKFASVAFYLYMANRHKEINSSNRSTRVPIVLNYTGDRNNPVADASLSCTETVKSEVQKASRLGVAEALDNRGYRSLDETEILTRIENRELLELNRNSDSKIKKDYDTFRHMFTADPADSTFERLVNTVSDAIHHGRYDTYTPTATVQTFGWRCGLLKPRGNRANERRIQPDPEVLEAIILSVIEPNEKYPLWEVCEKLRNRYGIIVGGTESDRDHLDEWEIAVGASTTERDPLSNRNYERFKDAIISLGYAQEFADGVTIVSTEI